MASDEAQADASARAPVPFKLPLRDPSTTDKVLLKSRRRKSSPEEEALKAQLPPFVWGKASHQARGYPESRRFHLFTDIDMRPTLNARYGHAAVGGVVISAMGEPKGRWGRFVGEATNNEAEMKAILVGIAQAARHVDRPKECALVCHTDSQFCYRALRFNEVNKKNLIQLALKIHQEGAKFKGYFFERRPSSSMGIRSAETQARKALSRQLNEKYIRRRGSKGRGRETQRSGDKVWNPFEGDGGW